VHVYADPDVEDTIQNVKKLLSEDELVEKVNWTDIIESLNKCLLIDPMKPASSSAGALLQFEETEMKFEV
jgi:hypothetical protein